MTKKTEEVDFFKNNDGSINIKLKPYYVYALFDTESRDIFYIGKGKGNRYDAHLLEAQDLDILHSEKHLMIQKLTGENKFGILIISRHESENEALAVESVLIKWVYGKHKLTNKIHGHDADHIREFGNYEIKLPYLYEEKKFANDGEFSNSHKEELKKYEAYEYKKQLISLLSSHKLLVSEPVGKFKRFDPGEGNGRLGIVVSILNLDFMVDFSKKKKPAIYLLLSNSMSEDLLKKLDQGGYQLSAPKNSGSYRRIIKDGSEIPKFQNQDEVLNFLLHLQGLLQSETQAA